MIIEFDNLVKELNEITREINAENNAPRPPSIDEEVDTEMAEPHYSNQTVDAKFITKAYKYLKKLGYVKSQYQFSEDFLNKNKYYYGMVLCEERHPSIDAIHNLLKNISSLNDGITKRAYLDRLYEEGEKLITQRLFKYF